MALTFTPVGGLEGLLLVDGPAFPDERGVFMESFRADEWAKAGLPPLLQDNLSRSRKNVIRGLHFQKEPHGVGKLVRCARGKVYDVVVDVRKRSPTYGKWAGVELGDQGNRSLWVPAGFAHGLCALTEDVVFTYKVSAYWSSAVDAGLRWNDPAVGVVWPIPESDAIVSAKDRALPLLAQL
jgi:dTDP-4-dehydrorhamnose 3,5-epimerase